MWCWAFQVSCNIAATLKKRNGSEWKLLKVDAKWEAKNENFGLDFFEYNDWGNKSESWIQFSYYSQSDWKNSPVVFEERNGL